MADYETSVSIHSHQRTEERSASVQRPAQLRAAKWRELNALNAELDRLTAACDAARSNMDSITAAHTQLRREHVEGQHAALLEARRSGSERLRMLRDELKREKRSDEAASNKWLSKIVHGTQTARERDMEEGEEEEDDDDEDEDEDEDEGGGGEGQEPEEVAGEEPDEETKRNMIRETDLDPRLRKACSPVDKAVSELCVYVAMELGKPSSARQVAFFLSADMHAFLIDRAEHANDPRVESAACLALSHFALHEQGRRHVAWVGGIPVVVDLLRRSENPTIHAMASKTLAAMALYNPNRLLVLASGGVRALLRLVRHPKTLPLVLLNAMTALVNLCCQCPQIKTSIVGSKSMIKLVQTHLRTDNDLLLVQVCKLLANLVCNVSANQEILHALDGPGELVRVVTTKHDAPEVLRWALVALSNLSHSTESLYIIGRSPDTMQAPIDLAEGAVLDPAVLTVAATAIASFAHMDVANKVRLHNHGAFRCLTHVLDNVLLPRLNTHVAAAVEDILFAGNAAASARRRRSSAGLVQITTEADWGFEPPTETEVTSALCCAVCRALATLGLMDDAERHLHEVGGLTSLVALVQVLCDPAYLDRPALEYATMALSVFTPSLQVRVRRVYEGKIVPMDDAGGGPALEAASRRLYEDEESVPEWLYGQLVVLRYSERQLLKLRKKYMGAEVPQPTAHRPEAELYGRTENGMESITVVLPDV